MFADGVPGLSVQHSGSIAGEIDGREFRIVAEVPGGRRFETLWSCKAENMTPEQVGRAAAFVRAYRLGRKSALVSGE